MAAANTARAAFAWPASVNGAPDIDPNFLKALASSPDQVYIAPTSADLAALFARVAQQIKLRLVS